MHRTHPDGWLRPLAFLVLVAWVPALHAQEPGTEPTQPDVQATGPWNDTRALELMERARERRQAPVVDDELRDYQAEANGYVYFYLDEEDSAERSLVKVDQVALDVYWAAPNRTHQRIVGRRDAQKLPSRIYYHLDHLAVVQNEFDDRIRLGDGDEVSDVLHPAAPGASSVYDFRLADSLSIQLGGVAEPIRVYEVEVRPQRMDQPAFIGSVFLDRASAAIVRMTFTFTPASYVDPRLDYINISLDNGLWDGKHWLPNEQRLEIRRELPAFDFPAGTVIRGVFRVGDYRFNQSPPDRLFRGSEIVALPPLVRERHEFPTGLFDDLNEEGLATRAELTDLRTRAIRLAGRQALSGLPRLRLFLPNASSVLRYNRTEGAYLGAGLSYTLDAASSARLSAGYASGPSHIAWTGDLDRQLAENRLRLTAEHNVTRGLGVRPGASGALNTLHAALAGKDAHDLYFVSAAQLSLRRPLSQRWKTELTLAHEEHRAPTLGRATAPFNGSARFRDLLTIDEGRLTAGTLAFARTPAPEAAAGWGARLEVEAGSFEGDAYLRPTIGLEAARRSSAHRLDVESRGMAGFGFGELPAQRLFLFGGRTTLPGYDIHRFVGDRFALADVTASAELLGPWVRLRALGAIGWSDLADAELPADWGAQATRGLRTSLGMGLGLVYDVLRVDVVRGLDRDGRWETIISAHPRFWGIL